MKNIIFLELAGSIILMVVCVVALYRMRKKK